MSGRQRKYNLLYLPAGKLVEILGPPHPIPKTSKNISLVWHTLSKNRSDLKEILNRILNGSFPITFYKHNEMISKDTLVHVNLKSCHFVFQRATIINNTTESE